MEFDIDLSEDALYMQGETSVDLPEHFIVLPLAIVRENSGSKNIIIACGRKEPDGDVDFMTGDGRIMSLKKNEYDIPKGKGAPIDGGKAIAFIEANPVRLIDSSSIISCAKTIATS